jgi:hypothetical protein
MNDYFFWNEPCIYIWIYGLDVSLSLPGEMAMEVNMNALASREISLNKQNTNQDILQKALEKTAEIKQKQKTGEPRAINKVRDQKQVKIDLYA